MGKRLRHWLSKVNSGWHIFCFLFLLLGVSGAGMMQAQVQTVYAAEAGSDEETQEQYVTLTIERSAIGQGYLLAPTQVKLEVDDTAADVFERACRKYNITTINSGSIEAGDYYISAIENADSGKLQIPDCILEMEEIYGMTLPDNQADNVYTPTLSEGSYSDTAGWLFSVNHTYPDMGMSQQTLGNGDVIRVQFSIYGYGADIGANIDGALQLADKTSLIMLAAQVNANQEEWFSVQGAETAYKTAIRVLEQLDSTQEAVDAAYNQLRSHKSVYPTSLTISPSALNLETSSSPTQLYPVFVPANTNHTTVSYTSSHPAVAAVSETGMVTPLAEGEAVITATTENGLTSTMQVTVVKAKESQTQPQPTTSDITAIIKAVRKNILSTYKDPGLGNQWQMIALMRSGIEPSAAYQNKFYQNIVREIKEKEGVLSKTKYTEYSKLILTMTALGKDVENVGGYSLLGALSDLTQVKKQGINGTIWALIAVDARTDYEFPVYEDVVQTTRKRLIKEIISHEITGGGYSLRSDTADPDVTAMAVTALAPYYDSNSSVKKVIDRAISVLSDMQQSDGGYVSGGVANAESSAQVIIALTAMKIDPDTDTRFMKNKKSVLDALLSYYIVDNGFAHTKNGGKDAMATEQGLCALVAYQRYIKGQTSLYDMSDLENLDDKDNDAAIGKRPNTGNETEPDDSDAVTTPTLQENQTPEAENDTEAVINEPQNTDSGYSGKSDTAEESAAKTDQKKSVLFTAEELSQLQGKKENLTIGGRFSDGMSYQWTIHGMDIRELSAFDGTVERESEDEEIIAQLAEILAYFKVLQPKFPAEMMFGMETVLSDGSYGLFRYDSVAQTAEYIQAVTVENGWFRCILEQGGSYYLAHKSFGALSQVQNEASVQMLDEETDTEEPSKADGTESKTDNTKRGSMAGVWMMFIIGAAGTCAIGVSKVKKKNKVLLCGMLLLFTLFAGGCGNTDILQETESENVSNEAMISTQELTTESAQGENEYLAMTDDTQVDYSKYENSEQELAASSESGAADNKAGTDSTVSQQGQTAAADSTTDAAQAESQQASNDSDVSTERTCTLAVSCATILNHMEDLTEGKDTLIPADGMVYSSESVAFEEGENVFDVLQRVMKENKLHMEYTDTPGYNSKYIEGINNLYEFDCGPYSGWMYSVNGIYPNYGCSQYVLEDGDVINWSYTCDLGRDLGGNAAEVEQK